MPRNVRTREKQHSPLTDWVNAALANCRREHKKSLAQIAAEAEITLPYLTNVRYGDRIPSWDKVTRLAEVLGAKRKEAEEALARTLQVRRTARAARKKRQKAEKEWTRVWREMLVNYSPLVDPESRGQAIRRLVELWQDVAGVPGPEGASASPSFGPSSEAVGWLVLQACDEAACVRREALKALGHFDPDLSVAAARAVVSHGARHDDPITKATAKAVIREAVLRDLESNDGSRQLQALELCGYLDDYLDDLKDDRLSAALLQRAFRPSGEATRPVGVSSPGPVAYFSPLKEKPPRLIPNAA